MRILALDADPVASLPFRNALPGGKGTFIASLPVLQGKVNGLPDGLDAVVLTSDLQGRDLTSGKLVGEVLPAWLVETGFVAHPRQTLALLAGDLYAAPRADERGATGDVRPVWRAFANVFASVAGVCGNHDLFGDETAAEFARIEGVTILDGSFEELRGLAVGGVSGIVGKRSKPNRRDEPAFTRLVEDLLLEDPDVLLLHQGSSGDGPKDKGSLAVRDALLAMDAPPLVVFGHCHWERPLAEIGRRQLLNVDSRVVVLTAA